MAFAGNDSDNTVILIAPTGLLTATPFACLGWIRPVVDNSMTPYGVWSSSGDGERAWRFRMSTAPQEARAAISFNGSAQTELSSSTALALNIFHHLGMDFDGSTLRLFINGVLDNSVAVSGTIFASSRDLGIGGYHDGGVETASEYDGDIEDFRYYDRILDEKEWETIHRVKGLDGIVHGLVTRWPIDELPPGEDITASTVKDVGPAQLSATIPDGVPLYIEGELRERRAA